MQQGLWFDGRVALGRPVEVSPGAEGLTLVEQSGEAHAIGSDALVRLGSTPGERRFGHRGLDGWRLILTEPIDPHLLALLPASTGSLTPTLGRRKMGLLFGLTFAGSAIAALVIFAPEVLAEHMPMSWERKLGAAYELPIAATECAGPGSAEALGALIDRLDPEARADGFKLEVVDVGAVNAVALPGGRMLIFDGMLEDVEEVDAIAGIVAHEIAHVRRRHVAAALVRQLGLGTVVTMLGGGAVASNAGELVSLKFSRGVEDEADAEAIAMLGAAGIDPRPTAAMFESFGEEEGGWPEWLATHPASGERARRFAGSWREQANYSPALTPAQWRAMRDACGADGAPDTSAGERAGS